MKAQGKVCVQGVLERGLGVVVRELMGSEGRILGERLWSPNPTQSVQEAQ